MRIGLNESSLPPMLGGEVFDMMCFFSLVVDRIIVDMLINRCCVRSNSDVVLDLWFANDLHVYSAVEIRWRK